MNNNNDVRCYELSSGMNKTFKVSRMSNVVLLDLEWGNEAKHKLIFTDLFMFSGEERLPVKLKLDRLAYSLMVEEYPQSAEFIREIHDESAENGDYAPKYWFLSIEVASYLGISRFVLGLYSHVEIVDSPDFLEFVHGEIKKMYARCR